MSTIRDVAKLAGVAPITVSRVINNFEYVSLQTRERVQVAIRQLAYLPNTLARSLRSKQTGMLALVLSDITNPFWTTVARGVEDAASEAGFSVIFCNTDESEDEQDKYLRALLQKRVDGVLLVPAKNKPEPVRFIQGQRIPVVVLDRRLPEVAADIVRCESKQGAYQLVRLLLSLGHRKIAMVSGPRGISTADDRVAGYRQALREAGLDRKNELVYRGEFTQKSGYSLTQQVLASQRKPTALFAGNNFIAIGALKALRDSKVRVPEDMAVVGFDDLPEALVIDPFLTAAVQPAYEMGRRAAGLLMARLSDPAPEAFQEIVLPTKIVVHQSSGQPLNCDAHLPAHPNRCAHL